MTVKELISKLEQFPADEEVFAYLEFETDQGGGSSPGHIYSVYRDDWAGKIRIGVVDDSTWELPDDEY